MKTADIPFEDEALKAAVMALGVENAEDIKELRVRKKSIRSAQGIEYLPNLTLLDLTRNLLSHLDVSQNLLLEELYVGNNQIESLDLSRNTNLTHLEIFMNDISYLDLSQQAKLENLYADANDLTELDLTANPGIEELKLSDNPLQKLALVNEPKLFALSVKNSALSELQKQQLSGLVKPENLKL